VSAQAEVTISIPKCEPGIGSVIQSLDPTKSISGVALQRFDFWPDDRGYFLEIMRAGQGLAHGFDPAGVQVSAALSYPGTIKAFHYHRHQTDLWVPSSGMFQVVLVDLRPESRTYGVKNTLYLGALRPWQVLIPPGVGHGYKVIGNTPGMLIYVTNRFYNPEDEGRIPYNDPAIQYDWETQHK
jgi:dTDP-4-dehydrorhamnose 3,5-epimerase